MQFFIPKTYTPAEAEEVRNAVRSFLDAQGLPTDERRLWKLALTADGHASVIKVGSSHPTNGEEILLILQAMHGSNYYVCTATRGVVAGAPFQVTADGGRVLAVDFRES